MIEAQYPVHLCESVGQALVHALWCEDRRPLDLPPPPSGPPIIDRLLGGEKSEERLWGIGDHCRCHYLLACVRVCGRLLHLQSRHPSIGTTQILTKLSLFTPAQYQHHLLTTQSRRVHAVVRIININKEILVVSPNESSQETLGAPQAELRLPKSDPINYNQLPPGTP